MLIVTSSKQVGKDLAKLICYTSWILVLVKINSNKLTLVIKSKINKIIAHTN